MTMFWILCALLLVVALLFVVWPLWRHGVKSNEVVRDAANLEIYRDQLAEMDADLANGLLTPELYEQGKRELETRVLEEVRSPQGTASARGRNPVKALAIVLAIVIPVASLGLYWKLGNLNAFLPQDKFSDAEGFGTVLSGTALQKLEDKVAKNPNMPEDWLLLARSYNQLERYADAVRAYDKLTQLVPNEAQLWADYADALAMTQGQSLLGKPTRLLDKALAVDPNNSKALALAGSAAMERGDYPAAVLDWSKLLQQIPDKNSQEAKMVAGGLQLAHSYLKQSEAGKAPGILGGKPAKGGTESISGTVVLSAALKNRVAPDDTVFVLARAANGPPMPLAVIRKQVRDLPLKFRLDDSMAMSPQMKLSSFNKVVVIARISKSGNAMPQPGDLQGESSAIRPGSTGLRVNIDNLLQ
jgi:cytochrome c-type biogenesis protein CcmH